MSGSLGRNVCRASVRTSRDHYCTQVFDTDTGAVLGREWWAGDVTLTLGDSASAAWTASRRFEKARRCRDVTCGVSHDTERLGSTWKRGF